MIMKNSYRQNSSKHHAGFSMLEVVTAVVAASIIMIATLTAFNRIRSATHTMHKAIGSRDKVSDVLQLITEDLDTLAMPGSDTRLSVRNHTFRGITRARLTIENRIYDSSNKAHTFESVTWQTDYDPDSQSFILYRAHGGMALEDPILDTVGTEESPSQEDLQDSDLEPFIPVATGLTYFEILGMANGRELQTWASSKLPTAVKIVLSFADPVEVAPGEFEILEEDLVTRVIAVDRTRKIKYSFMKEEYELPDPNDFSYEEDQEDLDEDTEGEMTDQSADELEFEENE
ncbi:hypothetical protein STSP2_02835 [Anaerohalosphaera lusitana]|uniref:Type II secretory pathway, component PulJ n=1 Tax=Anaerohalosphaera lusitana TaxID=1936003 RepID=A0A1U9NNZ9_9BACT|nr:hypothetical protein [Anaerohalosphaera lusitana]AQT69641.1 hypothetical protein STSP2_02835 [Anaerohalosphaera lusitana]